MNQETKKTSGFIFAIVFIFCLVRSVVFTTEEFIGYYFETGKFSLTRTAATFWILSFLYSLLSAILISFTFKKHGNKAWLPCILFVANPVFLINQKHLSVFLINVLYILYLNCCFFKNSTFKNFSQFSFLFISAVISPKVALGFIPLIIFIELIPRIGRKKNKFLLFSDILSISAMIFGIALNRILTLKVPEFNDTMFFLNVAQHTESEKILSSLFLSVPSLAVGVFFICTLNKAYKKSKNLNNKIQKSKNPIHSHLNILSLSFFMLFIASFLGGYQTLSALPLFAPIYLLQLIFMQNQTVEEALTGIDKLVVNHTATSAFIFISVHYLCLRFYLEQFGGYIIADIFIINR